VKGDYVLRGFSPLAKLLARESEIETKEPSKLKARKRERDIWSFG